MGYIKDKSVLITGGAGFIGGAIERGIWDYEPASVDILDLWPESYYGDAKILKRDVSRSMDDLQPYGVVFHCAAMLGTSVLFGQEALAEKVNVLGTISVLHLQKDTGIVVQPNIVNNWDNPYMISKRTAERYGLCYRHWFGSHYVSVRLTDVYGPRQRRDQKKASPSFIESALKDDTIRIEGDGKYHMNLIYVHDVARLLLQIADRSYAVSPVLEIGSLQAANTISVLDYAKLIISMTGSKSDITHVERRLGQPQNVVQADFDRLQTQTTFSDLGIAETALSDGLQGTIKWYSEMLEWVPSAQAGMAPCS